MRATTWGNVTQLIFMPRLFPMNCYLVEEENGITLIDACMPFVAKKIHAAIKETGKPLTRILLTHAHEDHIGAVPYLKSIYPDAQVGISRRDAALLRGDRGLQPYEAQSPIKGGVPKQPPFEPDFLFDDEERIGSLTAIATPGHTPGHFCFLEIGSKTLIAGDAFQTKGGLAVSGHLQWKFPFPAMATWHARTAIESARKILDLRPNALAVGHGPAVLQPAAAIEQAIAAAQTALERRNAG
ncbi:MBL fold metallo-hydrolase [Cohnella phaseoli]|uniref:Glyoxylase-like metal-dependent hydrolase (Beta-lactamase superfamily II) n=1 Tax=Cohnella phaseoli TaxID=456490 RepID=A0A3D9KE26_9BACL|nr:MBL fold metallo-hydrolase [Cohnella phaseoli]RED84345.1 glyoxylase-like metal-dependent hydrolase (beta-lactamase superfamily II) [Cohnella phaseoli]